MTALRSVADKLVTVVSARLRPLPSYAETLFTQ
jgi:glutamine synthetase type III